MLVILGKKKKTHFDAVNKMSLQSLSRWEIYMFLYERNRYYIFHRLELDCRTTFMVLREMNSQDRIRPVMSSKYFMVIKLASFFGVFPRKSEFRTLVMFYG